jgi:hypothetical protein
MKPWLCAAGVQLRDQIDTWYPDRRSTSDGWIGDARHSASKSDHNPDKSGVVRAIDIDSRLDSSDRSQYIWLTRSENVRKPISVYLT